MSVTAIVGALEGLFRDLPLPLLDVWGRLAYVVGLALAVCAFGGFTFRVGDRWALGRERQAWDAKAIQSIPITFCLVTASGYVGAGVVLVPEAQTFESTKDLAVFLCVVLFGYPALVTVPFAYGLSDLIEGVPPGFIADWLPGYFINPSCFWIAYQLFGKDPDFRRSRTWGLYAVFVVAFLLVEPALWGHICADNLTPAISYRRITPALLFTTSVTWSVAPAAMLAGLPLARRFGMFWAEIPRHVKERRLWSETWTWEAGATGVPRATNALTEGWPLRMLMLAPFIAIMLLMVGATALVSLRSAERDANELAAAYQQQITANIELLLDEHLARAPPGAGEGLDAVLRRLPVALHGKALVFDLAGHPVASTTAADDPVAARAVATALPQLGSPGAETRFRFDHITERPLARTTWLAHGVRHEDPLGGHREWVILTLLPETYYLAGIKEGTSRSGMVFALALLSAVAVAATLAAVMTRGLRHISAATQDLARGDLTRRVPGSRIEDLDGLATCLNLMAERLATSIEELHANEARLVAEKRFVDTLLDSLPGVVVLSDAEGRPLRWNRGLEEVTGYSASEIPLLPRFALTLPELAAAVDRSMKVVLGRGQDELELPLRRKDGRTVPSFFKSVRLATGEGDRILTIGFDVSERRRLEEQLRQAQKMEAVGNLAGGVAHDFNNLLTVILSYAEILLRGMAEDDPGRGHVARIVATSRRAAELTRHLLAFSRRQMSQPVVLDLNQTIRQMEVVLHRVIGEDVHLQTRLHPEPVRCRADPGQIEQAILNLVVNARDAMPQGGSLVMETGRRHFGEGHPSLGPHAAPGDYVRVAVTDTGTGMTPEVLSRIFEPFFTTKAAGKGTGLGLAMVYGTVRQSGGMVEVTSEPGRGSTFTLYLPATEQRLEAAVDRAAVAATPFGTETVLFVEDEEALREVASRALTSFGFHVLAAAGGSEALRIAGEHPVDIVVTDVVMPEMSGPALAARIRERWPHLPVLFVSGHADDAVVHHGLEQGEIDFLAKPYEPRDLARKLRAVLDRAPM